MNPLMQETFSAISVDTVSELRTARADVSVAGISEHRDEYSDDILLQIKGLSTLNTYPANLRSIIYAAWRE